MQQQQQQQQEREAPLSENKKRGRKTIKQDGTPLSQNERNQRFRAKKKAEAKAQARREKDKLRKQRKKEQQNIVVAMASQIKAASSAMNVADSDPPTPAPVETPQGGHNHHHYYGSSLFRTMAPSTPLRGGSSALMPRTPLPEQSIAFAEGIIAARAKARNKKMEWELQLHQTTQQNNTAVADNVAQRMERLAQMAMKENRTATDKTRATLAALSEEEVQDYTTLEEMKAFGTTTSVPSFMSLIAEEYLPYIPEDPDSKDVSTAANTKKNLTDKNDNTVEPNSTNAQPLDGTNDTRESTKASNHHEMTMIDNEEGSIASVNDWDGTDNSHGNNRKASTSDNIYTTRKRHVADSDNQNTMTSTYVSAADSPPLAALPAKTPAKKALKSKRNTSVLSRTTSNKKLKVNTRPILPIFAVRQLGKHKASNILAFDQDSLPELHWRFDLLAHLGTIDEQLKQSTDTQYSYYLIGDRESVQTRASDLGLKPNDLQIHVPRVIVHAFPTGTPIPATLYFQESPHAPLIMQSIGSKLYKWKNGGPTERNIKFLVDSYSESKGSLRALSETDKRFAKECQLMIPSQIDMRHAHPFEHFKLASKGCEDVIIGREEWIEARSLWLKYLVQKRMKDDPTWYSEQTTQDKKRAIWNETYLEANQDKWMQSFMDPMILDRIAENLEDELEEAGLARADFDAEVETALRKHHDNLIQAFDAWEKYRPFASLVKHFVIFPENEELRDHFLHHDNRQINSCVGKADEVFPKATGVAKSGAFRDTYTFDDIPQDERTRAIHCTDALNNALIGLTDTRNGAEAVNDTHGMRPNGDIFNSS